MPNDIYGIVLKGKSYYHLRDIEEGNFMVIDEEKNVYTITHNPL